MSSDEVNHSDVQPSNESLYHSRNFLAVGTDLGSLEEMGVDLNIIDDTTTSTTTTTSRHDWKQKDTIDGSSLLPPPSLPPPSPPPRTDRYFTPVGTSSSVTAAATYDIVEPNVFLRRRDVVTPPVGASASTSGTTHSTISGAPVVPFVSNSATPQLSPSTIASLRGISSPSNSQISIGSANPMLLNAVLSKKHYDLTPVMRNTSSDLYCDAKINSSVENCNNHDTSVMTITPSSQQDTDGYLHGEHLAFPSDLSRATLSSGPAMPPLQPVAVHRRCSQQPSELSSLQHHSASINDDNDTSYLHMDAILPTGVFRNNSHSEIDKDPIEGPAPAVQFPSRKYYSFTTREQYEEACRFDPDSDDDLFMPSDDEDDDDSDLDGHLKRVARGISPRIGLVPYAPDSRQANFDIEQVPEEELKRIFISRDTINHTERNYDPNNAASSSFELSAEHKSVSHTSLTSSTIPFGPMRIPSLHMANQLCHDSTTSISYTDQEDEDSIVVRINSNGDGGSSYMNENDDASLSSFDSTGNLQAMITTNELGGISEQQDDLYIAAKLQLRQQRKRKQRRKKEQDKAMEWLQSVEAHPGNDIAEAASSKFLTTSSSGQSPYYFHHQSKHRSTNTAVPLQRQMSVPANIKSAAASSINDASVKIHNAMNKKAPPS